MELRPIPSAPGYFASDDGGIYSSVHPQRGKDKLRRLRPDRQWTGYLQVGLVVNRSRKGLKVHRLVAEAFHGPCPDGMQCRHLDGSRTNNRPENLAWGTRSENMRDKPRHGTDNRGEKNPSAKINQAIADEIRTRYRSGGTSQSALARRFGISQSIVSLIVLGKVWSQAS